MEDLVLMAVSAIAAENWGEPGISAAEVLTRMIRLGLYLEKIVLRIIQINAPCSFLYE